MRLLLVEDDKVVVKSIELMLAQSGIVHDTTDLGEEAIDLAKLYDYDAVLLDLGLPDMSGHEVIRHIRLAGVATPVVVLTGDDDVSSKIKSFGAGADEYIVKPFDKDELMARLQAVVRRSNGFAASVIQTGGLEVNLSEKTVRVDGRLLPLTGKEYQMLELLSLRRGKTVTKDMFLSNLYGGVDEPEPKIIDVFVCKLRKKISALTGGESYIETVWGRGYVMNPPEQSASENTTAA